MGASAMSSMRRGSYLSLGFWFYQAKRHNKRNAKIRMTDRSAVVFAFKNSELIFSPMLRPEFKSEITHCSNA